MTQTLESVVRVSIAGAIARNRELIDANPERYKTDRQQIGLFTTLLRTRLCLHKTTYDRKEFNDTYNHLCRPLNWNAVGILGYDRAIAIRRQTGWNCTNWREKRRLKRLAYLKSSFDAPRTFTYGDFKCYDRELHDHPLVLEQERSKIPEDDGWELEKMHARKLVKNETACILVSPIKIENNKESEMTSDRMKVVAAAAMQDTQAPAAVKDMRQDLLAMEGLLADMALVTRQAERINAEAANISDGIYRIAESLQGAQ